jgi:hypothetical protein
MSTGPVDFTLAGSVLGRVRSELSTVVNGHVCRGRSTAMVSSIRQSDAQTDQRSDRHRFTIVQFSAAIRVPRRRETRDQIASS